jgi:hypothetical protein
MIGRAHEIRVEDPLAAWRPAAVRRLDGNENGIDVG